MVDLISWFKVEIIGDCSLDSGRVYGSTFTVA